MTFFLTQLLLSAIISLYAANATTFYNFIFLSLYCMKLSQMQALKSQKGGFTLVELIVVITILAILATVGFLSYQSHTKTAKSAAVVENIQNLEKAINLKGATAADMTSLINTGATAGDRTITVGTGKTVYGNTDATSITIKAGEPKWSAIPGIAQSDMGDATSAENPPLVGYVSAGTNVALQIASTIMDGDIEKVYIRGNFTADGTGSTAAQGLIALSGSTTEELKDNTVGNHYTLAVNP
jgi:prepilin-type N-terminal cleavage/methylation domain-containing protein